MNAQEKNLIQDTVLSGGLIGAAIVWLAVSAFWPAGAHTDAPAPMNAAAVASPVASPAMAGTPTAQRQS